MANKLANSSQWNQAFPLKNAGLRVRVEEGVTHYCVANMPGAHARTATQALTNATYRCIETLADHGLIEACRLQPSLVGGINVMAGKVAQPAASSGETMEFT